ncbi:Transcription factor [Macleaya cordata]|uniref:Transcription factor n=1 Tax=Macleaya cordata TaxID=56857 RepID=A0A200PQB8_MACCD|nr:Transcription factor [Macleaya cordata]
MGEDLDPLSLKELQNLEQQLDNALKHIRSRKNHLLYASIAELRKKEKALQEQNTLLGKKIKEKEEQIASWPAQQQNQSQISPSFLLSRALPSLTLRTGTYQTGRVVGGEERAHESNTIMPRWMLGHVNQ